KTIDKVISKTAELKMQPQVKMFSGAIQDYRKLLRLFPDSDEAYKAQFMIGFVYSENLNKKDKAREAFVTLLTKYPECDLVESAKYMIKVIDNPDVEKNMLGAEESSPEK
ncbi:MAG: tetratricopeptide repeat protein, partial [Fibrobacterota bacterium]